MPIDSMAGRRMTLSRQTAFVLDVVALIPLGFTFPVDRQSEVDALIQITVSGTTGSGTVTVNGDVAGVPTGETLTFSGPGTQVTVNRFDAGDLVSVVASTGWSSANNLSALAVGSDGSRLQISSTVATGIKVRLDRSRGQWLSAVAGRVEFEKTRVYVSYTTLFVPQEGDVWIDELSAEEYEIKTHPNLFGGGSAIPDHWEFEVERREQASTS